MRPALDCHTGGLEDFAATVRADHQVIVGSPAGFRSRPRTATGKPMRRKTFRRTVPTAA